MNLTGRRVGTLAAAGLCLVCRTAHGALRVWEGRGSGDTNDWFNASNWQGGERPLAGDSVVIDSAKANVLLTNTTPMLASFTIGAANAAGAAMLTFTNWLTALRADEVCINAYGTLTCSGPFTNAPAMSNRVWVVCSNLTVQANGKIDVDKKGYAGGVLIKQSGSGPGAGLYAGWTPLTSAGYGGRGGSVGAPLGGATYGSAEWPEHPGSGGTAMPTTPGGGAGGGAIRVDALDTVRIDGTLTACGEGVKTYTSNGSGGGILVTGRVIRGVGAILANGGDKGYSSEAGGGGRIALHYDPAAQQALDPPPALTVSAASGTLFPAANSICEFGTLWFPDRSFLGCQSVANLRGWLHIAGFTNWCVPALALTNAFVGFPLTGFRLEVTNDVAVSGNGALAFSNGAAVVVGGDCGAGIQIRQGSLLVAGDMLLPKRAVDNYQCRFIESDVAVGGDLAVSNTWMITAAPSNGVRACGSLIEAGGGMRFGGDSRLFLACSPTNGGAPLLRAGDFVLAQGTTIDATGLGFGGGPVGKPGYGPGGGKCLNYGGGGGYGGRGGGTDASHGVSNGLAFAPTVPGSGGGAYNSTVYPGGAGGGLVHIEATNSATIDGSILANGTAPTYSGSGAGGGIFIRTPRFAGGSNAVLRANGGSNGTLTNAKRGGGGRICVWYGEMPEEMAQRLLEGRHGEIGSRLLATTNHPGYKGMTYAGAVQALAGVAHSSGPAGEADGTVCFVRILPPAGAVLLLR